MKKTAQEDQLVNVKEFLIKKDFDIHQSTGANRTIIGVIGDTEKLSDTQIEGLPGVLQVIRIAKED
jgi:hypothetical protein